MLGADRSWIVEYRKLTSRMESKRRREDVVRKEDAEQLRNILRVMLRAGLAK